MDHEPWPSNKVMAALIIVALVITAHLPILVLFWTDRDYATGYAYCLPSKLHGHICAKDAGQVRAVFGAFGN